MTFSPRKSLEESARLAAAMAADAELVAALEGAIDACVRAIVDGRKLLTCGNGGSATDANHLAEELVGRFSAERRSLPAICLSVDGAAMTCIANDYGFESIFSRPVESLGESGDVLVAFTTSGKSPNVLRAMEVARAKGVVVVGLLGKGGGPAKTLCDHALVVPSDTTARIQEAHTTFLHLICEAIDAAILGAAD